MKILALEFSSSLRTAAVLSVETPPSQIRLLGTASDEGKRKVTPLRLIDQALGKARVGRNLIEMIAVGLGPGSYTGIRSAIAVAQGWQLARGSKLIGIETSACLAAQAQDLGLRGSVGIVIDAQRNEYYFAEYEISSATRRLTAPIRICNQVQESNSAGDEITFVGPEVKRFFPRGLNLYPDASVLGRLAADHFDFVRGDDLAPIYLRDITFVKAPPCRILPNV